MWRTAHNVGVGHELGVVIRLKESLQGGSHDVFHLLTTLANVA